MSTATVALRFQAGPYEDEGIRGLCGIKYHAVPGLSSTPPQFAFCAPHAFGGSVVIHLSAVLEAPKRGVVSNRLHRDDAHLQ